MKLPSLNKPERLSFPTIRMRSVLAFVRQNKFRILRYTTVFILILLLLFTVWVKLGGERYARQVQTNRTYLLQIQTNIHDIMQPIEIELGQQDLSVDYLLKQLKNDRSVTKTQHTVSTVQLRLYLLPHQNEQIGALNEVDIIRTDAKELLSYHYSIIHAVGSLLEYNPRGDLGDERLSDSEIELRIKNAKQGLITALNELNATESQSVNDRNKAELKTTVHELQKKLTVYEKSRNKDAWYAAVDTAQKTIISNRQAFWRNHTDKLYAEITAANNELAELQTDLQR